MNLLKDTYDLHVHCSPDVVPRAQDVYDLARSAADAQMAGIGLKDHTTSTIGRSHTLNRLYPNGPRFFSSLALNPPVGGLNPAAVQAALATGVDIVYFPTYSAAHHIDLVGPDVTPVPHPTGGPQRLTLLDIGGNLSDASRTIIQWIRRHDAILATGHISPRESLIAIAYAASLGCQRMVVTHASQSVPDMSIEDQRQAAQMGALIEHCFLSVTECGPGTIPLGQIAEQIRAVGVQHVILSSDFGQIANGLPIEAFGRHIEQLSQLGFDQDELRIMLTINPGRLVSGRQSTAASSP